MDQNQTSKRQATTSQTHRHPVNATKSDTPFSEHQQLHFTTHLGAIDITFSTTNSSPPVELVTITQDGQTIAETSYTLDLPPDIHPISSHIWRRYQSLHLGNFVIRSGFGLCGCYTHYDPSAPPSFNQPESDTEHASGCVELMRCLQAYYPHLLSAELFERAKNLLNDHDIGEVTYGDHPDDGSQIRAEKDQAELINFTCAAAHLPTHLRAQLISDFLAFQDPLSPKLAPQVAQFAQLAKVIDKCETILSAMLYESSGHPGDLHYKRQHFTPPHHSRFALHCRYQR